MSNKKNRSSRKHDAKWRGRTLWIVTVLMVAAGLIVLTGLSETDDVATASPVEFTDVRAQTSEFIAYYNSIKLSPEQEAIKEQALTRIPAPCCSDNSAHTCCCPCNMAKTWWGLANHLIADEGYEAQEVQAAVEGWIAFIHPDGFSGKACYTGGCGRPFHEDGCGGMNEEQLVF